MAEVSCSNHDEPIPIFFPWPFPRACLSKKGGIWLNLSQTQEILAIGICPLHAAFSGSTSLFLTIALR
jgi:hypothetical protein